MSSVDSIYVTELFFKLNIFCIEGTNDHLCLGKEPYKFIGLRHLKRWRKVKNTWVQGLGCRTSHKST